MLNQIKYFWKSFIYFSLLIFSKKNYQVVFVYLNHFNRGNEGDNLFLQPMISSCEENNISYIVFEDTDLKGAFKSFPRNTEAVPFDFITFLRVVFRKLYGKKKLIAGLNDQYFKRERLFSKIIKKTIFRNFSYDVCINMAGDNLTLFRGLDSETTVCEYQHGIIYNGHVDYLVNNKVENYIFKNSALFLLYGQGFKNLLIEGDLTHYYTKDTVFDVGINKDMISHKEKLVFNNKVILFTLQMTTDFPTPVLEKYKDTVEKIINENKIFLEKNNYKVIFKHHPRYNSIQCPHLSFNCDFITIDTKTKLSELLEKASLHLTFNSTTCFEASFKNMPTIFIDEEDGFSPHKIFFKEYKYPLANCKIVKSKDLESILRNLESEAFYKKSCQQVYEWASLFYKNYDETMFFKLIKKHKS